MTVFNKSSILFLSLNFIRLLSIVALVLAFSGEVVVLSNDLKGFRSSSTSATADAANPSSTATTTLVRRMAYAYPPPPIMYKREIILPLSDDGASTTTSKTAAAATPTKGATTSSTTTTTASSSSVEGCSYIGNTSVPKQVGGVVFVALSRIFCCLILILALVSEMPPPTKFAQRCWANIFPPFGTDFGVGVLGLVQVFVGASILNHSVTGFPMVAAWFLFVVGFLNLICGLAFGARINRLRSLISTGGDDEGASSSGLRSLLLNAASHAGSSAYNNFDTECHISAPQPVRSKAGIQIRPAMMQQGPPVYTGRGE